MRTLATSSLLALVITLSAHAEQKNVKLLTGLTDLDLQRNMNLIRASLGVHCDYCHVVDDKTGWNFAEDSKREKIRAREMIQLTRDLNARNFGGKPVVNCNTCHNGHKHPALMPPLPQTAPPFPTPVEDHKGDPAAKDLIAKHITAIGGEAAAKKILNLHTMTAKGVRIINGNEIAIDLTEVKPDRLLMHLKDKEETETQALTGDGGFVKGKDGTKPLRPSQVENVTGLMRDFDFFMPQPSDDARTTGKESIDGHEAWIVTMPDGEHARQRLYFDATSGLLVRRIVLVDGPIGRLPRQMDYSDYRDVDGVKVPFTTRVSLVDPWVGGTRRFTEVHLDPKVEESAFKQ